MFAPQKFTNMSLGTRKEHFAKSNSVQVGPQTASVGMDVGDAGRDEASEPWEPTGPHSASVTSLHDVQGRERVPTTSLYGSTGSSTHPTGAKRMYGKGTGKSSNLFNEETTSTHPRAAAKSGQGSPTGDHQYGKIDKASSTGKSGKESSGFSIGAPLSQSRAAAGSKYPASSTNTARDPHSEASDDHVNLEMSVKLPNSSTLPYADNKLRRDISAEDRGASSCSTGPAEERKNGKF
jgi:hypothetical protein